MQLLSLLRFCSALPSSPLSIPDFKQTKAQFLALFVKDQEDGGVEIWRLKTDPSKKRVFLTLGNIVELNVPALGSGKLGAVVNAANSKLSHGGGGTQRAFQGKVDKTVWDGMFHPKTNRIKVSECVAVRVPADAKWPDPANPLHAEFIFNCLGPVVSDVLRLQQHQLEVFLAYRNMFAESKQHKLRSIQTVLLSVGNYCYLFNENRRKWIQMVECAFVAALIEAYSDDTNKELESVVLVDLKKKVKPTPPDQKPPPPQLLPLQSFLSF